MNLVELVSSYSNFGVHRTGWEAESATNIWLEKILTDVGADVERHEFAYDRYLEETTVKINDQVIPSTALYYEAVGELQDCGNLGFGVIDIKQAELDKYTEIVAISNQAKLDGRSAVLIATRCENNSLHAFNVTPVLKNNLPTILVPGNAYNQLKSEPVSLDFRSSISNQTSDNIIADFGKSAMDKTLVITTPISGWFNCAAERGVGIAIAINLAKNLSKCQSIRLVLTSGHELGYFGGFEYTKTLEQGPSGVIHIGSCVGALYASLNVYTNFQGNSFDALSSILVNTDIGLSGVSDPLKSTNWVGEAECWAKFGCPIISVAGDNPLFHTPEDQMPEAANSNSLSRGLRTLTQLSSLMVQNTN